MPLTVQLVYMSAGTRQFGSAELTALLTKARQKNESLNVSGMLVYHGGSFLQVLEGSETVVDSLYDRIAKDDRHTKCSLLLRSYIDRRSFGDWSMGFVNTKLLAANSMPGFSDFFSHRFSSETFADDPSTAHKLLLAFRDGQYRRKVDIGNRATAAAT